MGPYKIITVETGYVAKTYNRGVLEILDVGQHIISDASHIFAELIPTKQETKKLQAIVASTRDNVGITMHADVRYQIENPQLAVTQIDDIENSIKEIAEISIAQIVSHHSLADFAPATATINYLQNTDKGEARGIGEVIRELSQTVAAQLAKLGIKLINIGITSWEINDKGLAHELAQGAVVKSQTQSRLMAAENGALVKKIETDAECNTILSRAQAEAGAVEAKGKAYGLVAQQLQASPMAQSIYQLSQQIEMVSHAKNANLFFSPTSSTSISNPTLVATIPTLSS